MGTFISLGVAPAGKPMISQSLQPDSVVLLFSWGLSIRVYHSLLGLQIWWPTYQNNGSVFSQCGRLEMSQSFRLLLPTCLGGDVHDYKPANRSHASDTRSAAYDTAKPRDHETTPAREKAFKSLTTFGTFISECATIRTSTTTVWRAGVTIIACRYGTRF